MKREMLLFASYCGDDNPDCTPKAPCPDCLAMSNVYLVDEDGMTYLRELAPRREEYRAWQSELRALIRPLRTGRPLSASRYAKLVRLADAIPTPPAKEA